MDYYWCINVLLKFYIILVSLHNGRLSELLFTFTDSSYNLDFEYFLIITFFCGFFILEKTQ